MFLYSSASSFLRRLLSNQPVHPLSGCTRASVCQKYMHSRICSHVRILFYIHTRANAYNLYSFMYRLYITRRYFNVTVTEEPRICTTGICPIDTGYTFLSYARNVYILRIRFDQKKDNRVDQLNLYCSHCLVPNTTNLIDLTQNNAKCSRSTHCPFHLGNSS